MDQLVKKLNKEQTVQGSDTTGAERRYPADYKQQIQVGYLSKTILVVHNLIKIFKDNTYMLFTLGC